MAETPHMTIVDGRHNKSYTTVVFKVTSDSLCTLSKDKSYIVPGIVLINATFTAIFKLITQNILAKSKHKCVKKC